MWNFLICSLTGSLETKRSEEGEKVKVVRKQMSAVSDRRAEGEIHHMTEIEREIERKKGLEDRWIWNGRSKNVSLNSAFLLHRAH